MKRKNLLFAASFLIFILACQSTGLAPTPTVAVQPTDTLIPTVAFTATATLVPTKTPIPPTSTPLPTPTPAQVGEVAANDKYEVSIVNFRKLDTVYLDSQYHWAPKEGYKFVELGIKVKNLTGSPVSLPWNMVYITDAEGSWFPGWGFFKAVASGVELNPRGFTFAELNGDELIKFDDVVFLRAIWTTPNDGSSILFGFDDSPLIEVTVK